MANNLAIDLFDAFATDTTREEEGAWETYAGDVKFLIARSNNKAYARALTRAFEKNKLALDVKGDASEALAETIVIDVTAKHILLGWEGNLNWKGAPLGDYSVEKAKQLLALKDFRRWVLQKAEDFDRFKLKQEESDKGE